ncbi:MAG TPA: LytTR family DNA-binding domain-containing protein [Pyrinomonadaceae bacterium]|nr:LytTR family DNA-binding domain-containing protein [Pyrinomonadaceae bacterium]
MQKLRVLIADDERPAREFLKTFLRGMDGIELVGEAEDGESALELIRATRPDLALLDIQMPELTGLDVVRRLEPDEMPLVVFVTAFDEFAVNAFEVAAVDYLLKPIEAERLQETVARARTRLNTADSRAVATRNVFHAVQTIEDSSQRPFVERIPVRVRDEIVLVPAVEIASIIADGELLHLTTDSNFRYTFNFRLKDLEARLDPDKFVRVSRGAIVALSMISSISPLPGGIYQINLANGQQIVSSRLQSRMLRDRLLRL